MIKKIGYKNFKAFPELDIELAPITLLLGPNNSGKSSIMSGLKIMNQTLNSIDENVSMLLKGKNGDFGTYKDVVHGNKSNKHMELSVTVDRPALRRPESSLTVKYKYRTKIQKIIAKEIIVRSRNSSLTTTYSDDSEKYLLDKIGAKCVPTNIKAAVSKSLEVDHFIPRFRYRVFPSSRSSQAASFIEDLDDKKLNGLTRGSIDLRRVMSNIEYVGAMRLPPERTFMYTGEKRKSVGSNGEYSVNILAMDTLRKGKKTKNIKNKVESWLIEADIASEISINKISDRHFELKIRNKHSGELENYADVGYGNSQILPVLVAGYNLDGGSTLLIEEPEIHLHPKAQFCIGDYLLDLKDNGV